MNWRASVYACTKDHGRLAGRPAMLHVLYKPRYCLAGHAVLTASVSGLQLVALVYYVASYFPGGTQGVKFVLMMASSAVKQCTYGVRQAVFGS